MSVVPVFERGYTLPGPLSLISPDGLDEEEAPQLVWPKSLAVYDLMRKNSQVISVLRAVMLPILRTTWRIDGAGCKARVSRHVADDLGLPILGKKAPKSPQRMRDRFSWAEHLRHALLELVYGHSYFEQIYRIVDGKAHIRKLGWRPPKTIAEINVASDGGLIGIKQYGRPDSRSSGDVTLPVEILVAYVNAREGSNWLGQSLLRPAYGDWWLKMQALRTQSVSLDRNGLGVPVYGASQQPEELEEEEAKKRAQAELKVGLELAQSLRGGENAGVALPYSAKVELMGVNGKLPDALPQIKYFDDMIARAVLAHFLNLGSETGSWALGTTFADFFTFSLQTIAQQIADVATQHIVEDLVDLNYGPDEPAPRVIFDEIGSRAQLTAESIYQLVQCQAIVMDEPTEEFLRINFGMPAIDYSTRRKAIGQGSSQPGQTKPDDETAAADEDDASTDEGTEE